jgi:hypothetical protein
MKIYPNPTSNFLYVLSEEPVNNIIITDIHSQVSLKSLGFGPIDISTLKPGIYFCHASTRNKINTIKFIKTE